MEQKIKEIVLTVGLPASGKTTWAKKFCEENPNYVRINRDDLRNMSGIYWLPKRENYITDLEKFAVEAALKRDFNVVLDATNFNKKVRNWIEPIALEHGYQVREEHFATPLQVCIQRDKEREKPVGKAVIESMYVKYFNSIF